MVLKRSFLEKRTYVVISLLEISPNRLILTWWFWAELNNLWRASHKLSSLIYSWLLNCIALVAGRLLFLTQFMSSQGPHFLLAISLIFPLKKFCFVFLTIPLNLFQSLSYLNCLYVSKSLWQLLSHHALECLVMFIILECLYHILSILSANDWTIVLRVSTLSKESVLSLLMKQMSLSMKWAFSSLFLSKDHFLFWTHSLRIEMSTVMGVWSDINLQFGWTQWLSCSIEFGCKNIRSNIKFESWVLSEYLVEKNLVSLDSST